MVLGGELRGDGSNYISWIRLRQITFVLDYAVQQSSFQKIEPHGFSRGPFYDPSLREPNRRPFCRRQNKLAGLTRFELAASCVTGRRSNQAELQPRRFLK